jgi:RHS repeat-associated protein
VAPWPCQGSFGDGGPATQAGLEAPLGLAVGADGSIYVSDTFYTFQFGDQPVVRYIGPDGIINRIAGGGHPPDGGNGDNGFADRAAIIWTPHFLALAPDGRVYLDDGRGSDLLDPRSARVRRLSPVFPGMSPSDISLPSSNGTELYLFDKTGRHKRTLDGLTQAVLYDFAYDSAGRLASVTDRAGNVTAVERNSAGAPTAVLAPGGQRTTLALGSDGYLSRATNPAGEFAQFSYAAGGLMASSTDPRGGIHHFTYDGLGRLTRDEDPAGGFQVLARTDTTTGYTVTRTTALNRVTTYQVEELSTRALRHTTTDPAGARTQVVINPDGSQTASYQNGSTVSVAAAPDPRWGVEAPVLQAATVALPGPRTQTVSGQRTTTLNDPGNPLSVKTLTATVTVNGRTSTAVFDATARTITQTSPANRTQVVTLDAKGRVIKVVPAAGVDPINRNFDATGRLAGTSQGAQSWTYGYDAKNRLTSTTDAAGNQVSYAYDAADRLIKTTLPGGEVYQFTYDANGNRTQVTMPNSGNHLLTYTPVDLESSYTPPGGTPSTRTYNADRDIGSQALVSHGTMTNSYDAGGRITGKSFAEGAIAFAYAASDPTDRFSDLARTEAGGAAGQDVAYGYSGPLVTSAAWTKGAVGTFTYTYNNDFFLTAINLTSGSDTVSMALTRDADGLPTGMGPFTLTRGGPGGALSQLADAKLNLSLAYDTLARATSRTDTVNSIKAYEAQLTVDAEGRVTAKTESANAVAHTYAYQYDKDGQLTKVTRDGTTVEQYTYDGDSNRVSRQLGTATAETATYDAQDRLTQRGALAYQFDGDGFLKQRGTDTFTYSARGELLSATIGTQTIAYGYDGLGRRIRKTIGTATTQYLYGNPRSPLQLTQVRNAAGQLTTLDYDDSGLLVALDRGGSRFYVSTDQLGSPRVISDATGAAVKVLDFDAFGVQTADSSPTFDVPVGFAGGLADPDTGLVHFSFRDYEPASGRWTARDPALFGGRQGNLYAYVGNGPVLARDPTGLGCASVGFFDVVGAGFNVCITGKGVSVCEEVGFGFGGGIGVDPTGALQAAGNDLVAQVDANCGPLNVSANVTLNHCGDVSWDADAGLYVGPVGIGIDRSGEVKANFFQELEGPHGSVKAEGFNAGCSIGAKLVGRFCQRFGG